MTQVFKAGRTRRGHPPTARRLLIVSMLATVILLGGATIAMALLSDSGTVDVRVTDNTTSVVDETTAEGAYVSYFGDKDNTFGPAGTGTFEPFVRLQADGTESGYNTNGTLQFDTKGGTWTKAIKVSSIPQRPCPSGMCFELFNDINESNAQQGAKGRISLNEVEVWYTDDANLTGYPFAGDPDTTLEYDFSGDILINDVNQGSGRGDLRYLIPIGGDVTVPADCDYGNPACATYFVLYSEWGTTGLALGDDFATDGGFEEWKVKVYPAISLTKTPDITDVCNDSATQVTYTYVVTNNSPGGGAIEGTVVDDNGTPGDVTDDVIVGTFSKLAAGASQTFTQVLTVDGTRTNIATATATDSKGADATATATATVTGHDCSISLTKTPSVTDVCTQGGAVTYTYVVTNTGDFFNASGTVTDDIYGSIGLFGPLAPGASKTLTYTGTITETTTNTGTANATFDDAAATTASATAKATVTAHDCSISLTKTPSVTEVCVGSNTQVTYTYVVTNTGDFFDVSGTVTDDIYGTIGSFGPLAPGASAELTKTAIVNDTVTNVGTATGTFSDPASTSATATDDATVTGETCAQITPTNVDCDLFTSGTAPSLSEIEYSLKDGLINQTNPGVFFYWVNVSGPGPFTINQTLSANTLTTPFALASGAFAFDSDCNSITSATISQDQDGNVTINGSGIAVLGVKYSTGTVKGEPAPNPSTVTYTFGLAGDPTSVQSIDLVLK
jgi:hypothetical protein